MLSAFSAYSFFCFLFLYRTARLSLARAADAVRQSQREPDHSLSVASVVLRRSNKTLSETIVCWLQYTPALDGCVPVCVPVIFWLQIFVAFSFEQLL